MLWLKQSGGMNVADAWETITAAAADTSDAWTALNSQQTSSGVPGSAVDEISFTVLPAVTILANLSEYQLTASISTVSVQAGAVVVSVPVDAID